MNHKPVTLVLLDDVNEKTMGGVGGVVVDEEVIGGSGNDGRSSGGDSSLLGEKSNDNDNGKVVGFGAV